MIGLGEETPVPANIKVVGVGGGGNNALSHMIESGVRGVQFIAANTDNQALQNCNAERKLQLGENITKGLGAGGDPELGKKAAQESKKRLYEILDNSDMVFIGAGMGGGTGTGAAPIISGVAREIGALTVGVVTKPFVFEGKKRVSHAEQGIKELKDNVDTLIVIPNDRLLQIVDRKTSMLEAFRMADNLLKQGVQGVAELITVPGLINLDLADIKRIMHESGSAIMGLGEGYGENRINEAVKMATSSPLLETSMEGAKSVLLNISGSSELGLYEVNRVAEMITETTDKDAEIIFGTVINDELRDKIEVTVIATNFKEKNKDINYKPPVSNSSNNFDIPAFLRKKEN